jgi:hypothetical protein
LQYNPFRLSAFLIACDAIPNALCTLSLFYDDSLNHIVNRLDAAGHCLMAAQVVLQSVQQLPTASSPRVKDAVAERTAELEKRFGELYVIVCSLTLT